MLIKSTQPDQPVVELAVHFVAFASAVSGHASGETRAGLSWPKQIERSVSCRQAEFVFGRLAARHALTQLSPALASALVPIGGDREPLWPECVLGSITHVPGLAGAAVVPANSWRYLGIDLEQTARGNAQRALRTFALDSAELALLQRLCEAAGQPDLYPHVTHVFSAKECLYKAAFPSVRRFFGFSEARLCGYEFLPADHGPEVRLALEITEGVGGEFVAGSRWWIEVWRFQNSDTCLSVLAC
ncbi:MAG: 4'-phosphopantetheinyl transferase superfamily protein [Sideroxyarcus sp.]|nr:4'-phosphopantetheinyl transferase superfamily protein [Sideroxyarcus sp.]